MAVKVLGRQKGRAEAVAVVECPFCEGKGIDPFHLMSTLSSCPVCLGRTTVRVREPRQECAFCRGSGVHPYTRMSCTACLGKGAVTMRKPVKKCAECGGTGANGHDRMPCSVCKGIGVVPTKRNPKRTKAKVGSAKS